MTEDEERRLRRIEEAARHVFLDEIPDGVEPPQFVKVYVYAFWELQDALGLSDSDLPHEFPACTLPKPGDESIPRP